MNNKPIIYIDVYKCILVCRCLQRKRKNSINVKMGNFLSGGCFISRFKPCSAHTLILRFQSNLDEKLQPLHPVTVVLEEVLQFPDVLQQVRLSRRLTQGLLEQPGTLRHPGHVLHQHLLPPRRHLGSGDWGANKKDPEWEICSERWLTDPSAAAESPQIEYRSLSITTVSLALVKVLIQSRCWFNLFSLGVLFC